MVFKHEITLIHFHVNVRVMTTRRTGWMVVCFVIQKVPFIQFSQTINAILADGMLARRNEHTYMM